MVNSSTRSEVSEDGVLLEVGRDCCDCIGSVSAIGLFHSGAKGVRFGTGVLSWASVERQWCTR